MTNHPNTPEQDVILRFISSSKTNLMIKALAGAAKTSTLVLIARALRGTPMLCVAFNKRIAKEMEERLPSHCVAKTMNAIGHQAWQGYIGKKLHVDANKLNLILRRISKQLSDAERAILNDIYTDVLQLTSKAKLFGYVPQDLYPDIPRLIDRDGLRQVLVDMEYDQLAWDLLDSLLVESINESFSGSIDFDDQVYMSTLFGGQLPRFPFVMIDEAQDLSPLNHRMLQRLVTGRLVAVGDPNQAIYGFRGAVSNSMDVLQAQFNMETLPLTVCFRCASSIVEQAKRHAPDISAPHTAPIGLVEDWREVPLRTAPLNEFVPRRTVAWGPDAIPNNCAVICRNNGPLISLGLRLITAGRAVQLIGFDISKRIIKILREFGDTSMPQSEVLERINNWRTAALAEGKLSESSIEDRTMCLIAFAQSARTLSEAITKAEALFSAKGPIELLSGHKSKGLEWETVFHLDPWRIPSKYAKSKEEIRQENNIDYVIATRAKYRLVFFDLDNYDPEETSRNLVIYDEEEPANDCA